METFFGKQIPKAVEQMIWILSTINLEVEGITLGSGIILSTRVTY